MSSAVSIRRRGGRVRGSRPRPAGPRRRPGSASSTPGGWPATGRHRCWRRGCAARGPRRSAAPPRLPPSISKAEHRPGPLRRVLLRPVRSTGSTRARPQRTASTWSCPSRNCSDLAGVLDVALDAQAQRLDALRDQEGVERRDRRAEVAEQLDPGLEDEGEVGAERAADAEVPGVDEAVVARVRGVVVGEPLGVGAKSNVPPSTMTPAIDVPWPPRYFVAECTTMSAPHSSGRMRYGVAMVLSTIERDPGLVRHAGDPLDVEDVRPWGWRWSRRRTPSCSAGWRPATASRSSGSSTKVTSMPNFGSV